MTPIFEPVYLAANAVWAVCSICVLCYIAYDYLKDRNDKRRK